MPGKHETIIRHYYNDVFCAVKINIAATDPYLGDAFIAHHLPLARQGHDEYKKFISMLASSFSEMNRIHIHDLFSCDDRVVARWSWSGKHTAEFMGIPATSCKITMKGIDIFRLSDGKITNLWQEIDMMGILQQISAPPAQ